MWPEILEGFHTIGILEMELYQLEERLFMIVETPLDFDWDTAMERLATLPGRLNGKLSFRASRNVRPKTRRMKNGK